MSEHLSVLSVTCYEPLVTEHMWHVLSYVHLVDVLHGLDEQPCVARYICCQVSDSMWGSSFWGMSSFARLYVRCVFHGLEKLLLDSLRLLTPHLFRGNLFATSLHAQHDLKLLGSMVQASVQYSPISLFSCGMA